MIEPRDVALAIVRVTKRSNGRYVSISHIGDFLQVALLQKWEKGSSDPVNAKDIDSEAFCEIVPGKS